jgi:hypothetical protein
LFALRLLEAVEPELFRCYKNAVGIALVDTKIVRQTSFVVLGDGPLDRDEPDTLRGEAPDMRD